MALTVTGSDMPQTVDIKGVGKVNFPDTYTPEQIQKAIETDILPSTQAQQPTATPKAQQPVANTQSSANEQLPFITRNTQPLIDRAENALLKGAAGVGTLPNTITSLTGKGLSKVFGDPAIDTATQEVLNSKLGKVIAPSYSQAVQAGRDVLGVEDVTAQTRGGKIVDSAIENLNVGSRAAAIASALAGAGSEVGGQIGAQISPEAELAGRFIGGGVTGAGVAGARALKSTPERIIASALPKQPTDAAIQQAIAAQLQGKEVGVPLTAGESFNSAPLNRLLANASSTPQGNAIADEFFKQRAGQVKTAVNDGLVPLLGENIPPNKAAELSQKAATDTLNATDRAITDATRPYYTNLPQVEAPQANIENLVKYLDDEIAKYPQGVNPTKTLLLQTRENLLKGTPEKAPQSYEPVVGDLPNQAPAPTPQGQQYQTNAQALQNVRQELYRRTELPNVNAESIDKKQFEAIAPVYTGIDETLRQADPTGYAKGQDVFKQQQTEIAAPLKRSLVGELAGSGYDAAKPSMPVTTAAGILFDPKNSAEEIRNVYKNFNNQDPTAYPALVRAQITDQFDKATKDLLQTGDSPASLGAKFTQALTGTQKQKENFSSILAGVDEAHKLPVGSTYSAFDKVFNVLRRTAQTPSVGSPTGEKTQFFRTAGESKVGAAANVISFNPLKAISDAAEARAIRNNSAKIVEILTSPDSVELVAKLAKTKPKTASERILVNQIIQNAREAAQYEQGAQ